MTFDINLLNQVKSLLINTYTNPNLIEQSSQQLDQLRSNNVNFADVLIFIIQNENDLSLKKSAFIQIKYFDSQIILNIFVLFNQILDASFHRMIAFLSDILASKDPEILFQFILGNHKDEINEQKAVMMGLCSLLGSNLPEPFRSNIETYIISMQNSYSMILQNILEFMNTNENINFNIIVFLHYFTEVYIGFLQPSVQNYEIIHHFTCKMLIKRLQFPEINIINKLLEFYTNFYGFVPNIKFEELIKCFDEYKIVFPLDVWPIEFIMNIKSFVQTSELAEKFSFLYGKILNDYLFPPFVNVASKISILSDENEFIDTIYPTFSTYTILASSANTIYNIGDNDFLIDTIYQFCFHEIKTDPSLIKLFSIINFLSYCSIPQTEKHLENLLHFYDTVIIPQFNNNEPLIVISVMHFLSKLNRSFFSLRRNFLDFLFCGIFNQIQNEYEKIIRLYAILTFSNFCLYDSSELLKCSYEQIVHLFNLTIYLNELFRNDESSEALVNIIDIFPTVVQDPEKTILSLCEIFFNTVDSNVISSAKYFSTITQIFEKCNSEQQSYCINIIFHFLDKILKDDTENKDKYYDVNYVSSTYFDEIIDCIDALANFIIKIENKWPLFQKLINYFLILTNNLDEIDLDIKNIDKILLKFVQQMDESLVSMFLNFYNQLISNLLMNSFHGNNIYSLRKIKEMFGNNQNVQQFENMYPFFFADIVENEEEEEGFEFQSFY